MDKSLNETTIPRSYSDAKPSLLDRLCLNLGIRPVEQQLVAVLFSNMFFSGLAIGMIRVCAFTLFLEHFASQQLAIIAILLAFTGTLATLLIDKSTKGHSTRRYVYTILFTILASILTLRGLLQGISSTTLIFFLPLFFEVVYMLFSLQFITLLTRLLNVRQTKRLSGITRSGEFLAEMVGGLSIVILLNYMNVRDLLMVAALAVLAVIAMVYWTSRHFSETLNHNSESADDSAGQMLPLIKLPYVRMIAFCYAAYIFAYFFLEIAFYQYAALQFPDEQTLATFIGQFFAVSGFLTLLTMVFLFAPFLRKFGILAGILTFPLVIVIGASSVSLLVFAQVDIAVVFIVMVITNCLRFILQSAVWRPTVSILFQVLPSRQRKASTSLIEGLIDPISGGLAGLCLYLLSEQLGFGPEKFLLVLSGLLIVWLLVSIMIRKSYLSHLVSSIQKRKLGEVTLAELDGSGINIILSGLKSRYSSEVFYCLSLLEELDHTDITEHLKSTLEHANADVRLYVLTRISQLELSGLAPVVRDLIDQEQDADVLGQALKSYALLEPELAPRLLKRFLNHLRRQVKKCALVGLLDLTENDLAQETLINATRSELVENREFAAEVLMEVSNINYASTLVELLEDRDAEVVKLAVTAAGLMKAPQLSNLLINKLKIPNLRSRAGIALQEIGEPALADLNCALSANNTQRQVRAKIIEIMRNIGGVKMQQCLLSHINMPQQELRHLVFISLANSLYQAEQDQHHKFASLLNEEVETIAWLLASLRDLSTDKCYAAVHEALCRELDLHRDNMLLLTSFIFVAPIMLNSRANLDSKYADLRVFALEVLDNLLSTEIKRFVIPLLEDISIDEQLSQLAELFPQVKLGADQRFDLIMNRYYHKALFWTRASLLHHLGESNRNRQANYLPFIEAGLQDHEALVRETAIWCFTKTEGLSEPDTRRTLKHIAADKNPDVSRVAKYLLARHLSAVS